MINKENWNDKQQLLPHCIKPIYLCIKICERNDTEGIHENDDVAFKMILLVKMTMPLVKIIKSML